MANWNTRCAPARMPPITSKRITETKKAIREKDGLFHFGLQRFGYHEKASLLIPIGSFPHPQSTRLPTGQIACFGRSHF